MSILINGKSRKQHKLDMAKSSGFIVEAVRHMRTILQQIDELDVNESNAAKMKVPMELLESVKNKGKLPVPNFSAGGIATPADAALMMHLGADAVFVGSGIFKSENPSERAKSVAIIASNAFPPIFNISWPAFVASYLAVTIAKFL